MSILTTLRNLFNMSDNITRIQIQSILPTNNDGSTPIILADGTTHTLKAGVIAASGQYLVIDEDTKEETVASFSPADEIEVPNQPVPPVTFPTFADALAAASTASVAVVSASNVVVALPLVPTASVTLLVSDLTSPWTVQATA